MTNTVTKATNFFGFALKKFMLVTKRRGELNLQLKGCVE